ncbi:ribonuclease HII [Rhodoplanes elegans]|uniref:ribonuclease HII n=1 Tax=Rhodoplanes elegans TaxID=29408 RepID=UPI001FD2F6CE|nr:ribonuclease HII [Rhodoplanes elegans]
MAVNTARDTMAKNPAAATAARSVVSVDGAGPDRRTGERDGDSWAARVAAAVILDPKRIPRGLDDSKKLTAERRAVLFERICAVAEVGVAMASPARIDRDNIRQASLWALARAVKALPLVPRLVFVDGCDRIEVACDCEAVVSGDALVLSIAAASIVAKVTRDRLMEQVGAACPGYGFERHMGYGVPEHQRALAALGATPHHRRSFAPVRAVCAGEADGAEACVDPRRIAS